MIKRQIGISELRAIVQGKIPPYDWVGKFNENGYAKTQHNGSFGVINSEYKIILEPVMRDITILDNNMIVAYTEGGFEIFSENGFKISSKKFTVKHEAVDFAKMF